MFGRRPTVREPHETGGNDLQIFGLGGQGDCIRTLTDDENLRAQLLLFDVHLGRRQCMCDVQRASGSVSMVEELQRKNTGRFDCGLKLGRLTVEQAWWGWDFQTV